jgi:hypothetical protein
MLIRILGMGLKLLFRPIPAVKKKAQKKSPLDSGGF